MRGAVADRRPPDHRLAAARLHRHQHDLDPRHPHPGALRDRARDRCCGSSASGCRIGRHIYAIGANEKAAALNGIPVRAYVIGVFVASGLIAGFAGCILAAKLRIGQANVGLDYLLPALVGAFLGTTTIKPGRVNVWGTIFGVLILAVGISGIQQLGGAFFVEPLFNGTTLVISIALAAFAQRRRAVARPTRGPSESAEGICGGASGRPFEAYRRPPGRRQVPGNRPDEPRWLASNAHREERACRNFVCWAGRFWPPPPSSARRRQRPGRRRRLHEDGQGLHRQGHGAGDRLGPARPAARRRRARS